MCHLEEALELPLRPVGYGKEEERLVLVYMASEGRHLGWNFITGWELIAQIEKEPRSRSEGPRGKAWF